MVVLLLFSMIARIKRVYLYLPYMRDIISLMNWLYWGLSPLCFVLGSGKGTQCAKIVDQFHYVHLSAGDLLRAERNRPESELAQMIEEYIKLGKIIPVAITCSLIERAMNEHMQVKEIVAF